jgi:hypothetical protein
MSKRIFDQARPLSRITSAAHDRIRRAVDGAAEADVLAADPGEWGQRLAESELLEPPAVQLEQVEYEDLGPVQVDATNMPGVSFSLSEWAAALSATGEGSWSAYRSRAARTCSRTQTGSRSIPRSEERSKGSPSS